MKTFIRINLLAVTIALMLTGIAVSQGIIATFSALGDGDAVILEWSSGIETGLDQYQVERSFDGLEFFPIADIPGTGSNSTYIYEDHDIYKSSTRTYYYRIRAVMEDGTFSFSSVQSVTLNISGIQQTWGSIKALFR
jgi:hypothetical protein